MKGPRLVFELGRSVGTAYGAALLCALSIYAQPAHAQEAADDIEATTSNVVDATAYCQSPNVSDVIKHLRADSLMCGSLKCTAAATAKRKANFSGVADYYADCFHGRRTASGQVHDRTKLTAAHRTLPFGTKLKVVNRHNGKSCVVTVNDRGPFTQNRIIDLSAAAAKELGLLTGSRMVDCYLVDAE